MKILKYKKLKDNRYELLFENLDKLILYDDVIIKFNLLMEKDIDNKLLLSLKKYNDQKSAYYKSLKYISKKLRSEKEIIKYLEKLNYEKNIINKTIIDLKKDGYLNNKLFINAYINDAINLTKKGSKKIKWELKDLGFSEEEIDKYLDKIEQTIWVEKIDKYIDKKIKLNKNNGSLILKEKIKIELINLGYEVEDILSILNNKNFNNQNMIKKEGDKYLKKLSLKYNSDELKFHLRSKLYSKGFSSEEINEYIETI